MKPVKKTWAHHCVALTEEEETAFKSMHLTFTQFTRIAIKKLCPAVKQNPVLCHIYLTEEDELLFRKLHGKFMDAIRSSLCPK